MAITTLNNRAINRSDTASSGQLWTATSATASDFQAGGGAWTLLQAQTASTSSTISFTSTYITSTYDVYVVIMTDLVKSADGGDIFAELSIDNGSNFLTTYRYMYWADQDGRGDDITQFEGGSSTSSGKIDVFGNIESPGNVSPEIMCGEMILHNPNSARGKLVTVNGIMINGSGELTIQKSLYSNVSTSAVNNIKFTPNSGTITSGSFTLYGLAKS